MSPKVSWALLGLTLLGVSGAFVWESLHRQPEVNLPILGQVQDFMLTTQDNRPVSRKDFLGKTWVADFIYTTCPDQCPMMSRKMETIQSLLPKEAPVRLVSISVDPKHDTPTALRVYAQHHHADLARWSFLVGTPATTQSLLDNFKLTPPGPPLQSPMINHSARLVLVDAQAQIRGYYDGTDDTSVQKLVKDLSALAR